MSIGNMKIKRLQSNAESSVNPTLDEISLRWINPTLADTMLSNNPFSGCSINSLLSAKFEVKYSDGVQPFTRRRLKMCPMPVQFTAGQSSALVPTAVHCLPSLSFDFTVDML